ncbi:hypothetical protein B0H13DRAFT_2380121 [Mycena leptocephala]|nr:hypothetical protein B0H13DRAFT_2380121 [Mycena leptocephala]
MSDVDSPMLPANAPDNTNIQLVGTANGDQLLMPSESELLAIWIGNEVATLEPHASSRSPVVAPTATDPPAGEDSENTTPTFPADGYARLAQEIHKLAPGSTVGITSPKKQRLIRYRAVNRGGSPKSQKYNYREHIIEVMIELRTTQSAPDVEAWKRILEMLLHLGNDGMSSEEEFGKTQGKIKCIGYKVKICAWRAQEVDDILVMVDSMGEKLTMEFDSRGPRRRSRVRSDETSVTGAPKGLPECLYDAGWIARESKKSPLFYADLAVSKEVFYLLAASADMVE